MHPALVRRWADVLYEVGLRSPSEFARLVSVGHGACTLSLVELELLLELVCTGTLGAPAVVDRPLRILVAAQVLAQVIALLRHGCQLQDERSTQIRAKQATPDLLAVTDTR